MAGLGMLKKPKPDEGYNRADEDHDFGTSLLEALTKAHDERRTLGKKTAGLLEVDAKFKEVKNEKDKH